jgi:hypothetical protein
VTSVNGKVVAKYRVERILLNGRREFFGVHLAESDKHAIEQARDAYGPRARNWTLEAAAVK